MVPARDAALASESPSSEAVSAHSAGRIRAATVAWIALVVGYVVAVVLAVQHLFYGVDMQDETYYLALAYRFAKGAKPFVSEISLHQFAALLEAPLVKAYVDIVGSTDGIVLASRMMYLLVLLFMIAATVCALRRLIGWQLAAAVCLPLVFYAPMAISGLSYNSIATLTFLACCGWGLASVLDSGTLAGAVVCGLFAVLVVVAYPPWLFAVLPTLAIYVVLLWRRGQRRRSALLMGVFGLGLVLIGVLLLFAGVETVIAALRLNLLGRYRSGFAGQAVSIARSMGVIVFGWPVPLLCAIAMVALRKRAPLVCLLMPVVMVLSLVAITIRFPWLLAWVWTSTFVWYLGGLSFVLYWGVRDHPNARTVLWTLCVPGLIAGAVVSFSSFVGEGVAGQGLLVAMIGASVFILWLVGADGAAGSGHAPEGRAVLSAVAYIALLAFSFWFLQANVVFNDETPEMDIARVDRGPWRGLLTTPQRRDYVMGLSDDLARLGTKDKRVLVLSGIPGAYLVAQGTITVPTAWLPYVGPGREAMLAEQRKVAPPDFIVVDTHFVNPPAADDPFLMYAKENGLVVVLDRAWYRIYARR